MRYWFEFCDEEGSRSAVPGALRGCGVTAIDVDDALNLLRDLVFKNDSLPKIGKIVENIDISTLDPDHILPNMAPPNRRGVWFPQGYEN